MLRQVCWILLLLWVSDSKAQIDDTYAASLGSAPVGLYSRSNSAFGESENAASLGNAPVGLYHKHHSAAPQIGFPVLYGSPAVVPSVVGSGTGSGGYGPRSHRPIRPIYRPIYRPVHRPYRPIYGPPHRPTYYGPHRPYRRPYYHYPPRH